MLCDPNTSPRTRRVLELLADPPYAWHYGYGVGRRAGFWAGTLYPILACLTEQGWIEADWMRPGQPGHRARHAYRLTDEGMAIALRAGRLSRSAVSRGAQH